MITDGENWHYLTVKNLSELLRGITSNHAGDFYCLSCFIVFVHILLKINYVKIYVKIMIIVMQKCLLKIILQLNITKEKYQ